jgi:hypothetical protein
MGIIERKIILHSARASQAATLVQKEAHNLLLQEEQIISNQESLGLTLKKKTLGY